MSDIIQAREADRLYRLLKPYFLSPGATLDRGRGTAFPTTGLDGGALVAGERFFRTDIGMACYYDGTRWLTAEVFENNLPPYSRNPMPIAAGAGTVVLLSPQRTDYASYYVRGKAYMDVATTNNGANYWAFSLLVGSTVVWNANTSADAAGAAINKEHNVEQVCAGATYASGVVTKTGSPGTIVLHLTYWYRLIIT